MRLSNSHSTRLGRLTWITAIALSSILALATTGMSADPPKDPKPPRREDPRRDPPPEARRDRPPAERRERPPEAKRERPPEAKRDRPPEAKRDRPPEARRDAPPEARRDRPRGAPEGPPRGAPPAGRSPRAVFANRPDEPAAPPREGDRPPETRRDRPPRDGDPFAGPPRGDQDPFAPPPPRDDLGDRPLPPRRAPHGDNPFGPGFGGGGAPGGELPPRGLNPGMRPGGPPGMDGFGYGRTAVGYSPMMGGMQGMPAHADRELMELEKKDRTLEQQSHELAARLSVARSRGEADAAKELEAQIEKTVVEHFEVRQQKRRRQLELIRDTLEEAEKAINKRESLREQIIKRRLDQLLGRESELDF